MYATRHARRSPIALLGAALTGGVGLLTACGSAVAPPAPAKTLPAPTAKLTAAEPDDSASAVFAGGCFWCVEAVFEPLNGVTDVVSGYAGGTAEDANYSLVSAGRTDHAEVVKITYDPDTISYGTLLQVFFATHQPTSGNGQHPDYGRQYRPAVFYASAEERRVVEAYVAQLTEAGVYTKPIATGLEPLAGFYPAETYHQDFVKNNPTHPYVRQWALPKVKKVSTQFPTLLTATPSPPPSAESLEKVVKTKGEWRSVLSPPQFRVLREDGTERPFTSHLNKETRTGTYRCAGCQLALFASTTKFKSGTGWPSFYEPILPSHVAEHSDTKLGMVRTEIECARCDGHLGHVFNDGPQPTGLRYCINGVALAFDPEP